MSADTTIFVEDGEVVYPCRCGETHRGPYAIYDYGHHNCFHDERLVHIGDKQWMCPTCGKTFATVKPDCRLPRRSSLRARLHRLFKGWAA